MFLILSTGLPRRQSPQKITARWRYRLPIKNLTAHYNSQLCVSFHFCFLPGSPKTPLDMSKCNLKIILFISKMYADIFSYRAGLVTCDMWQHVTCHKSCVMCYVSPVACCLSYVRCHMSPSGEASQWRVCYQQCLPRLGSLFI